MPNIDELQAQINELKSELEMTRRRRGYAVVALFNLQGNPPQVLADLPAGMRSGLPTGGYDWPWDHAQYGNTAWHTADKKKPANWAWTHVGAKFFTSTSEAEQWLEKSEEAKFFRDNGAVVFTCSLTDYHNP